MEFPRCLDEGQWKANDWHELRFFIVSLSVLTTQVLETTEQVRQVLENDGCLPFLPVRFERIRPSYDPTERFNLRSNW